MALAATDSDGTSMSEEERAPGRGGVSIFLRLFLPDYLAGAGGGDKKERHALMDGKCGLASSHAVCCNGVMIPALDPESNFKPFGDSGSGFRSIRKWNRNTSSLLVPAALLKVTRY